MFTTSSLYCYIAAKIFICCRWWSSHKCLNGWIYLRWSLIKQFRSPTVHHKIIKYCYFSLLWFYCIRRAILHVNIDEASNAYCLATLIQDAIAANKKFDDKTGIFDRFFFNYKFLFVKIVANTIKKKLVWAYWLKTKIKKERTSLIWWLSVALQTVW